jgi:hypothetical protein
VGANLVYLIPYLISLGLSLGILAYAWQFKRTKGVKAYCLYLLGQTLMILGFIIELASPSLQAKIFWDSFQWLASILAVVGFPIYAVVDVWDAVQSERPYKRTWSRDEALAYIESQVGLHFDPQIVDLFLRMARDGRI